MVLVSTTSVTFRLNFPETGSSSSLAFLVRASLRWRSTRSTPKVSAAMSSRCRPMPVSSLARWISPMSISSRACRPRSPLIRSQRLAIHVPRWAQSPRSTTTSAFSMRVSAFRIARSMARSSNVRPRNRLLIVFLNFPTGPSSKSSLLLCVDARAPTTRCWPIWPHRGLLERSSMGNCTN
ncbi:unannotated protein [freshwater metagenome]|uniref:Unannotated protein n=1 Tax=freshwater metagenome TaxID=449393 RepID=A0A6J5ZXS7_9ZZZZ